jgi:hypothetical protein
MVQKQGAHAMAASPELLQEAEADQFSISLGLEVLHFVRRVVIGEGSLIVRPATRNTPSP